jgi:hypothetical protein
MTSAAERAAGVETPASILILERLQKVPMSDWEQNPTRQEMVNSKWYSLDSFKTPIRIPGEIVEFSIGLASNDYAEIPVLVATGHNEHGEPVVLPYWLSPGSPVGLGTKSLVEKLKTEVGKPHNDAEFEAKVALRRKIVDAFDDDRSMFDHLPSDNSSTE